MGHRGHLRRKSWEELWQVQEISWFPFFSSLLCSSLFSHSPRPRGPTINWLNHKRSLGSRWLSSLRLPPLSFGSKMVAAVTTGQAQSGERRGERAASPRERGRHGAGLCDRTVDPRTFPNNRETSGHLGASLPQPCERLGGRPRPEGEF